MGNVIFLNNNKPVLQIAYTPAQMGDAPVLTQAELNAGEPLYGVDTVFSTWGMPALTEAEIEAKLPDLKYVFYAAGSVQGFARPFLHKGVRVFSAWAANAIPVAEFTVSQILLANKGYFQAFSRYRENGIQDAGSYARQFAGNYGIKVGLLGAGMVGKKVIELLKPYEIDVVVFDPFLPEEKAAELGVTKAELAEVFRTCPVVSNHLANNAQTVGMLNYELFKEMPENGVFINTGRGAQVVEEDLVRAMREAPGRTALLDVTDPHEPVPADHIYRSVPNILITPHIAGSSGKEVFRMGEFMMAECARIGRGEAPLYEVTEAMLETMA